MTPLNSFLLVFNLNKYFAKGKDENVDSGLVEAIGMGLIEQTSSAEGKEAYKILINPFI